MAKRKDIKPADDVEMGDDTKEVERSEDSDSDEVRSMKHGNSLMKLVLY